MRLPRLVRLWADHREDTDALQKHNRSDCVDRRAVAIASRRLAFDDAMYPDLKGMWHRAIANGADGLLMPAKKDQTPPDLKYFGPAPR
jgi:hypothetical protein